MNTSDYEYDYNLKFILIGDTNVGKSNLILRYIHNDFALNYKPTIGVEFSNKYVTSKTNTKYQLKIWDTSGQERFKSIVRSFYINTACAIVVYDITNRDSFKSCEYWIEETKCLSEHVTLILVGNKNDLQDTRVISEDEGKTLAEEHGMLFIETSAKTGSNVNELFKMLVETVDNNISEGLYDLSDDSTGITRYNNNKRSVLTYDNCITEEDKGKKRKSKKMKCC
jgi:small GTP-binding protein